MILRTATFTDLPVIWDILQDAIEQRKNEGSAQWQDGYPNRASVQHDLDKGYAYVLAERDAVLAYAAVIFDKELAYDAIEGKWLTNEDYLVLHRVAVAQTAKGRGIATQLFKMAEELAVAKGVHSIKVDTNFDNAAMLKILDRLGYTYCGEVYFRSSARKAFEKVLPAA